jgi:hypothetical protein
MHTGLPMAGARRFGPSCGPVENFTLGITPEFHLNFQVAERAALA